MSDGRASTQFKAGSGFLVEFLTPNTGSADYEGRPTLMPALGGAAAEPLRFLDFLIHEPIRAVLLHGSGVPVLVPAPERYAVHKLIVGSRRRQGGDGQGKATKDREQAVTLLSAMIELRREEDVADAWMEAWDRGPSWRDAIKGEPERHGRDRTGSDPRRYRPGDRRFGCRPGRLRIGVTRTHKP